VGSPQTSDRTIRNGFQLDDPVFSRDHARTRRIQVTISKEVLSSMKLERASLVRGERILLRATSMYSSLRSSKIASFSPSWRQISGMLAQA
jgi:hypothetical protein